MRHFKPKTNFHFLIHPCFGPCADLPRKNSEKITSLSGLYLNLGDLVTGVPSVLGVPSLPDGI